MRISQWSKVSLPSPSGGFPARDDKTASGLRNRSTDLRICLIADHLDALSNSIKVRVVFGGQLDDVDCHGVRSQASGRSLLLDLHADACNTVLPMSRMANRASSGNALSPAACSMAMGLVGWNRTHRASPVLMKSGLASFPDLFVSQGAFGSEPQLVWCGSGTQVCSRWRRPWGCP